MPLRLNGKMVLWLALTVWFQMSFAPFLTWHGIRPDVTLLLLAFFAFFIDYHQLLLYAFLVGVLRDMLTNAFFGLETASLVVGALVLGQIAMRFDRSDKRIRWAGTFAFSFVTLLVSALLFAVTSRENWWGNVSFLRSFLIAVYTTLSGFVFFPLFYWMFQIEPRVKQYELF